MSYKTILVHLDRQSHAKERIRIACQLDISANELVVPDIADSTTRFNSLLQIRFATYLILSTVPNEVPPNFKILNFSCLRSIFCFSISHMSLL